MVIHTIFKVDLADWIACEKIQRFHIFVWNTLRNI